MFGRDHRTASRYYFQQPVFVGLQDVIGSEVETVTENVCAHGPLLRCKAPIALGSKVRVIVRFPSCVPIEGVGEVLRVEQRSTGGAFLIAVRCEAPLKSSRPIRDGAIKNKTDISGCSDWAYESRLKPITTEP
jgi:hypothetical protein